MIQQCLTENAFRLAVLSTGNDKLIKEVDEIVKNEDYDTCYLNELIAGYMDEVFSRTYTTHLIDQWCELYCFFHSEFVEFSTRSDDGVLLKLWKDFVESIYGAHAYGIGAVVFNGKFSPTVTFDCYIPYFEVCGLVLMFLEKVKSINALARAEEDKKEVETFEHSYKKVS